MEKVDCISVVEMARILGISKSAAYQLASMEGFKPAFRLGKRILINCHALEEWVYESLRKE